MLVVGLAALLVAPAVSAQQPQSTAPAPSARSATPFLKVTGDRFSLDYQHATRRAALEQLFAAGGVTVRWPAGEGLGGDLVSGRLTGTLDEIANRLLSGLNYVAVYDESGGANRLKSIVIHGPASAGEAGVTPSPGHGTDASSACTESAGSRQAAACSGDAPPEPSNAEPDLLLATAPMNPHRTNSALHKTADGKVIVFGGEIAEGLGETTDRIEEYDPATGVWTLVGHLSQGKAGLAACPLADGRLLLVGGYNRRGAAASQAARSADLFDPASKATRPVAQPSQLAHAAGAKALKLPDGRCLIASESAGPALEFFDPATESFTQAPTPPASEGMKPGAPKLMNLLPDGKVLIVGASSAIFDPGTGELRPVPGL